MGSCIPPSRDKAEARVSKMCVPILESDRLRLRGHHFDDFSHCFSLWSDPIVTRYITGTPLSREECWARFLRNIGHWALLGFGYWIAEEKATGIFVGELGFGNYKRELEPALPAKPEAGWVLASSAHGKGYATEALKTILAWGDANLDGGQTVCLIHPDNHKSIRIAEKCGYRKQSVATYKQKTTIVFARGG